MIECESFPALRRERVGDLGSSRTHSFERDSDLEIVCVGERIQGSVSADTEPT